MRRAFLFVGPDVNEYIYSDDSSRSEFLTPYEKYMKRTGEKPKPVRKDLKVKTLK